MNTLRKLTRLACAFALVLTAYAEKRVALIIGNGQFTHLAGRSQLQFPPVEAGQLADALQGVSPGFTVFRLTNATRQECLTKLAEFSKAAKDADCAIIHIGSHGLEHLGENYFFTKDTDPAQFAKSVDSAELSKQLYDSQTLSLGLLKSTMAGTKARLSFVILDACRERPEDKNGALRSVGGSAGGLAKPAGETPRGTVILYAADEGRLANDGLFTPTLIKHLKTPGLPIANLISRTGDEVERQSEAWAAEDEKRGTALPERRVRQSPNQYGKFNEAALSFSFIPGRMDDPTPPRQKTIAERIAAATKEAPFENDLGMEFVPVPGTSVLMCRTETRLRDWGEFMEANPKHDMSGGMDILKVKKKANGGYSIVWEPDKNASWKVPGFAQTGEHPVVGVSWADAEAFCVWLSKKEGLLCRLPKDKEWSVAVGNHNYPWGDSETPPAAAGNYGDARYVESLSKLSGGAKWPGLAELNDTFERTAPCGSFGANRHGIFDLGGNVWEWCDDKYRASLNAIEMREKVPALNDEKAGDGTPFRVLRGSSWSGNYSTGLLSSYRRSGHPSLRSDLVGFRVVVSVQ